MTVSAEMIDHQGSNVTTLCPIWKIISRDGLVAAYCAHTRRTVGRQINGASLFTFEGVTYRPCSAQSTRDGAKIGLQSNNTQINGVFDDLITRLEVEGGRWKLASFVYEYVNYLDLTMGSTGKMVGVVGKWTPMSKFYEVELLSQATLIDQAIGDTSGPIDRHIFPPGVDIADFTFARKITVVTDRLNFTVDGTAKDNDYFKYGIVRFKTKAINWENKVNATVITDNALQKTGGINGAYDGGGSSVESISAGQYFQCSANTATNNIKLFGATSVYRSVGNLLVEFGIRITDTAGTKAAQAVELGTLKGSSFVFTNSDFFRIRYGLDNIIRYYLVSAGVETLKYTSLATPAVRLVMQASFATTSSAIFIPKMGMDAGIQKMELKNNIGNDLTMQLQTPWAQAKDDDVELIAGYDGTREQLQKKYDDVINGDFEPDIPGIRPLFSYPE